MKIIFKYLFSIIISLMIVGCQADAPIQNVSIEKSDFENVFLEESQKVPWEFYIIVVDGEGEPDVHKFYVNEVGEGAFDNGYSQLECHGSGAIFATQMVGMCWGDPCNTFECVDEYVTYDVIPCYGDEKLRFTLDNDAGSPDVHAHYNTSTGKFSGLSAKNNSTASIISITPTDCAE